MKLLNKLTSVLEYIHLMGLQWFSFRVKYELLKYFNYFEKHNTQIVKKVNQCDVNLFNYKKTGLIKSHFKGCDSFIKKADEAIEGNIYSFSNEYYDYSENDQIIWQMNPISKIKVDNDSSWNQLKDFGVYGDIKLIWEASRFPEVYFFINAYAVTQNRKYAKACITQILHWIEHNPYPKGLNYKCGQEISFRVISWIVALEYFYDFTSEEDKSKIVRNIYTSLLRVDINIDFAAKSVKNNHSISEAAGLLVGGLLFPQFQESKWFIRKGLTCLMKETSYQIYNDGSYIQHSFIYQRLVLDVLSFVFLVSDKKGFHVPDILKKRHCDMANFLHAFLQGNGWLPNYGSNDGTNLFPVDNTDYRDFRTSLNFACGKSAFFDFDVSINCKLKQEIEFNDGGYYILKNECIFSFIRCHSYRDRPAQNDMFHLDVWYKGKNIFCDTGSYSYNTDKKFKNNFIGVAGHNTVMVNNLNQMNQVLNFGYTNWTKSQKLAFDIYHFSGENYAYRKKFGIIQKRSVDLHDHKLVVIDAISNIDSITNLKQIWNTKFKVEKIDKYSLKVDDCVIQSNIEYMLEESYISDYYNTYVIGTKIIFQIDTYEDFTIQTIMEFK